MAETLASYLLNSNLAGYVIEVNILQSLLFFGFCCLRGPRILCLAPSRRFSAGFLRLLEFQPHPLSQDSGDIAVLAPALHSNMLLVLTDRSSPRMYLVHVDNNNLNFLDSNPAQSCHVAQHLQHSHIILHIARSARQLPFIVF